MLVRGREDEMIFVALVMWWLLRVSHQKYKGGHCARIGFDVAERFGSASGVVCTKLKMLVKCW